MSLSIYYTARRAHPLTPAEHMTINRLIAQHAIDEQLAERERTGDGYNWESFCIYDPAQPTEPGIVFEGATKLPDNSEDAIWMGLQHWCSLLSEIRRSLMGVAWRVNVDDHDIFWNEERGEYDPSQ